MKKQDDTKQDPKKDQDQPKDQPKDEPKKATEKQQDSGNWLGFDIHPVYEGWYEVEGPPDTNDRDGRKSLYWDGGLWVLEVEGTGWVPAPLQKGHKWRGTDHQEGT